MGCVSSCFLVDDNGGPEHPNAPGSRICTCLRCLAHQLVNACTVLFRRRQMHVVPLPTQQTAPAISASAVEDSSISNTYRPPPRPLAYDDPRCSPLHHRRKGKASRDSHEESEPFRRNTVTNIESVATGDKRNRSLYGKGSKLYLSESKVKNLAMRVTTGLIYNFSSSEDEDVCPICLEEYTAENPRITMKCSHHFHLSCIYEWKERSKACPFCEEDMVFDETK